MKKKIAYAVFTLTDSGKDYMVKGNFGDDKAKAEKWIEENDIITHPVGEPLKTGSIYPNGLFVKRIEY